MIKATSVRPVFGPDETGLAVRPVPAAERVQPAAPPSREGMMLETGREVAGESAEVRFEVAETGPPANAALSHLGLDDADVETVNVRRTLYPDATALPQEEDERRSVECVDLVGFVVEREPIC